MHLNEIRKLTRHFQTLLNPAITVRQRSQKADSADVYLNKEFIGVISRDDEDGDLSYQFQMAILDIDLPEQTGLDS